MDRNCGMGHIAVLNAESKKVLFAMSNSDPKEGTDAIYHWGNERDGVNFIWK